jgi:hypothetical protein
MIGRQAIDERGITTWLDRMDIKGSKISATYALAVTGFYKKRASDIKKNKKIYFEFTAMQRNADYHDREMGVEKDKQAVLKREVEKRQEARARKPLKEDRRGKKGVENTLEKEEKKGRGGGVYSLPPCPFA